MFYIYILYSRTADKYYIGYSNDPWKRLHNHNHSSKVSYTSKYRPWELKAVFLVNSKHDAIRIERFIKKQKNKRFLERLIDLEFKPDGVLAQLVRVPKLRD